MRISDWSSDVCSSDLLGVESTVEADGGIDALHHRRRAAGEAPAPHGIGPGVRGRAVARFTFRRQLLRLGVHRPLRRLPAFMLAVIRVIRKTLAAAGLVALILALASPASAGGQQAASGGTPSAPEGPFGRNFTFSDPPVPAPSVPFQTLDGAATAFADFRGQVLLVNFWATWCVPCVQEMPALERLHLALADGGLAVLAISQDRGGEAVVDPFLARLDLQHLPIYLAAKGELGRGFALTGLPTTFVIGRDGRVLAGLVGPAERSEERRVGKEWVRRGRVRGSRGPE